MKVVFSDRAWEEYLSWQGDDVKVLRRLNRLIIECQRSPFEGAGKPEPLRGELRGWWSRRVTDEHRLAYRVSGSGALQALEVLQCRSHY